MYMRFRQCLLILVLAAGCAGCGSMATRKGFYDPIVADLRQGNYEAAVAGLDSAKVKNKFGEKDRFVYFIDAGLAEHYAARFDSSTMHLHLAEAAAEELFTKSISRAAASLLLNDNVLEYPGEDYEVLYTNLFKALNFLLQEDFESAFVEVRRANEKLSLLEDKYADAAERMQRGAEKDTARVAITYKVDPIRFHNDAFARYLSMHMYAADGRYDDARIDYEMFVDAFVTQPQIYDFVRPDVTYIAEEGQAILSIVAMAGLSPVKEDLNLRIRTDKDLNLVQILYDDGTNEGAVYNQVMLPVSEDYYFKFAVPQLVDRPSNIAGIRVLTDSLVVGELQVIEDVGLIANDVYSAKKTLVYLRSLARAIWKGLQSHKMKKKADTGGLGGWLKKAAIDVASDLTENADLRCSRLLPGRIYVGDFHLAPGLYNLTIEFYNPFGQVISRQQVENYRVIAGDFNLVQAVSFQ